MDKDAGSRGYLDRFDLVCWAGAILFLGLFCWSMLHHTRGQLSLPLDDSFIYFQYARQLAEGHFLRYNSGDPPTTGATSLLYLFLLVPGYWLGLHGMYLAVYALLLGLVCLGLGLWLVRRVGASLGDEESGKGAAAPGRWRSRSAPSAEARSSPSITGFSNRSKVRIGGWTSASARLLSPLCGAALRPAAAWPFPAPGVPGLRREMDIPN